MASSLKFVVTKPTERKNPETAMATFGSRVKTHRKKDEVKGYALCVAIFRKKLELSCFCLNRISGAGDDCLKKYEISIFVVEFNASSELMYRNIFHRVLLSLISAEQSFLARYVEKINF